MFQAPVEALLHQDFIVSAGRHRGDETTGVQSKNIHGTCG